MPAIVYKKFAGWIPNSEPHLLPDDRAQFAENCEFTDGSLAPMKGGLLLRSMESNPVRSIYTEDGIFFYTWSTETTAFRSPVIDEVYNRVYVHTPGQPLKVTTTLQMSPSGPSPTSGNTWNVGVPRPESAPVLQTIDRTTLPDYPSAAISFSAWYELGGIEYDRVETASASTITPWQKYTVAKPSRTTPGEDEDGNATGTPAEAKLVILVKITDGTKTIVSSRISGDSSVSSAALPGGIEIIVSGGSGSTPAEVAIRWGTVETRAYAYTHQNTWNEEGAPSPPSTISVSYIQDVRISDEGATSGFTGYRPRLKSKIYRTFGTGSTYIEATVEPETATSAIERSGASKTGTAMSSQEYYPPPPMLNGVTLMPNGWLVGFYGNTLHMSEPYRPHAWPYTMTFGKNIRGIHVGQQSLVVTTADGVHVVSGSFPASAQSIRLSAPQAGISSRGMTSVDGSVVYTSNDGLVFVSGTEASLSVSQKLFTRQKWRDLIGVSQLPTVSLGFHDGCLIGTSSAVGKSFSLRLDEDIGAFSAMGAGADAMFYLPVNDALYFSVGSAVYQFKAGPNTPLDWWGKDWIFPQGATFGAGYLRAGGVVTIKLYADGEVVYSQPLEPGYFRLPSMRWATRWSIRITGTSEVFELAIAQSMGELRGV